MDFMIVIIITVWLLYNHFSHRSTLYTYITALYNAHVQFKQKFFFHDDAIPQPPYFTSHEEADNTPPTKCTKIFHLHKN